MQTEKPMTVAHLLSEADRWAWCLATKEKGGYSAYLIRQLVDALREADAYRREVERLKDAGKERAA